MNMDLRPSRHALMAALTNAGIEFPESATLSQLRLLFQEVQKEENMPTGNSNANDEPTSDGRPTDMLMISGGRFSDNLSKIIPHMCGITDDNVTEIPSDRNDVPNNTMPMVDQLVNFTEVSAQIQNTPEAIKPAAHVPDVNVPEVAVNIPTDNSAAMPEVAVNIPTDNSAAVPDVENFSYNAAGKQNSAAKNELRNLQIRLEILKLQQQIRALETNAQPAAYVHRIDLMELDSAVPPFSGDDHYDVMKWFTQFEDYASNYTMKEKCVGVRRRLEGTAKKYANNLGLVDYDELKVKLINMFRRTVSRQEIYRQLRTRTLSPNETCLSYLVAMQSIASKADISEEELVDM
ncbi:uncharacterized protein LOC119601985 [Lucilia sericata]|uniref:uncharacterized protein LOC119601985 n=1 Tax=Lucilia sericata TaxID=13632 RepID=UPI0018A7EA58|nr:uncharacterized protein LOC119601985 [Lucilia sericata]